MISHAVSTELMYTISRQFNTSLDLDEVMGQVLRLTVEATKATHGSLFLLDEQGRVSRYILARPEQAPEISPHNLEKVMAEGLVGWVYQQQQGMLLDNIATHHRWVKFPDDAETHSALAAPLLHQNRVNGVLVLRHEQPHYFDESHLSLVTGIAGQAAIAVENARLFSQIRHERETLDALITGMPNPVLVIDAEEKIIFTNAAGRQLLALTQVDHPALASVEGGLILKAALKELNQNSTSSTREIPWSDGRIFNLSLNHVARLGTVLTLNDITELKRLDELKSAFVETVSHDLRNPLATIQGFAMLLEMENLSERGRSNLSGLLQGVAQIQNLIQNLLDLARIGAKMDEQIEPCDLTEIAEDVLGGFELQLAEKEMTLVADLPAELPWVLGNDLRLSQVVANLVSNAVKYTPKGGRITVGLSYEDGEIRLAVSDTGPGIPPEEQDQIFERFYRVPMMENSEWIEGTGLGLSIVKAIIEGYGGRVWVESEMGVGSTFICTLPALPDMPEE
ncbi:MAG: hypothetical protein Fur0044_24820 [Anaerolineae bacterium]